MIQEDFCSFEVAKLLKEKGFNIPCHYTYHGDIKSEPFYHHKVKNFNGEEYSGKTTEWVSCPTHQVAIKWLREEKRTSIIIEFDLTKRGYCPYVHQLDYDMEWVVKWRKNTPMKYEEAVEEGIKYALENLI